MKKLILICTLALMAIACSKEDDPQLILPDMGTHRNPAGPDSYQIKEIEKDRTCYGCCISDCPVAKDFNNERCDKYDDGLPF